MNKYMCDICIIHIITYMCIDIRVCVYIYIPPIGSLFLKNLA